VRELSRCSANEGVSRRATVATVTKAGDDPLALPRGRASERAIRFAREHLNVELFNHSVRTFVFSRVVAAHRGLRPGSDFDEELVYLGCVLHDIGLTDRGDGEQRYEVDGADVAAELLAAEGLEAHRVEVVWQAIALHTSFGINNRMRPEIALTAAGIGMDFGRDADLVGDELAEAIHRAYPRQEMARVLVDEIVAQARRRPGKAIPYTYAGELVRERCSGALTLTEQRVAASRWGR
jgi:hypothetical protein